MLRRSTGPANVFSLNEVAEDIEKEISRIEPRRSEPFVQSTPPSPSLPDYVAHREGVSEIGKLSAEAIVKEYEAAAKEIEAVGEVVKVMVRRCELLATSASKMLDDIKATAARYRKEGNRIFGEIESCSTKADDVRILCQALREKITTDVAESRT